MSTAPDAVDGRASSPRELVVAELARTIGRVRLGHPVRVAIDGVSAVGKTTLAGELVDALTTAGCTVAHVSADDFHQPRAVRHRQGRESADGYYEDAFDFEALVREVLRPLGTAGDGRFRARLRDLGSDLPVTGPRQELPADGVLVVDGSFLQRPETGGEWDVVVFVAVPLDVARARGLARDADPMGGLQRAADLYDRRYLAAARRYFAEVDPAERAHILIDNADLTRPRVIRQHPLPGAAPPGLAE